MHHINERFRISINIKVNHSLKSYQLIDNELIDDKYLGCVAFTLVREKELKIKINSKPPMLFQKRVRAPSCALVFKAGATHFLTVCSGPAGWTGRNLTRTILFRA